MKHARLGTGGNNVRYAVLDIKTMHVTKQMVRVSVMRVILENNVSTSVHILVLLQVWARIRLSVTTLQVNAHIVKQVILVGFVNISVAKAATKTNAQQKEDGNCSLGCILNHYGPRCEFSCSTNCKGTEDWVVCDANGACLGGCVDGYSGDKCLTGEKRALKSIIANLRI